MYMLYPSCEPSELLQWLCHDDRLTALSTFSLLLLLLLLLLLYKCVLTDCTLCSHMQDRAGGLLSLVVLCSDHGMSDHGGHGGSTPSETGTPLIFLSSIFQQGRGR